jgi:membrane-bound lytic murein transglycosylase D
MRKLCNLPLMVVFSSVALAQANAPSSPRAVDPPSTDQLFETGKALFDQFAPAEIKEQYDFPSKEQWDAFAARLQHALDSNNLEELAAFDHEAHTALTALRLFPGYEEYADWLQERIDYIEAAKTAAAEPVAKTPPRKTPTQPGQLAAPAVAMPNYDLWLKRMRARTVPERAAQLMPILRAAFVAEGVPAEIAWIAEAESTLNPAARSPAGAKGLFQLMPDTAKNLGLSTFLPDERADAEKSAKAAARYLHTLHDKFGDWPLAFAAYNAGEGRVRRLLKAKDVDTFAEIAASLPSETRMYVPKVCATIEVRSGVPPDKLPRPTTG